VTAAGRTVVVPAHNEAAVIARCLATLTRGASDGEFAVVVVSNGSTDETAATSRRALPSADVLDLPVASKPAALRAGLAAAAPGAVAVVDADVEVPAQTLRALFAALDTGDAAVSAARPVFATEKSSWLVRRYYRVWLGLPYGGRATVGSGVFALNQAARDRLGEFPDVLNDDAWVRRAFPPTDQRAVQETFVVHPARTARALVARRARVIDGNRELESTLGPDADGAGFAELRAGLVAHRFGPVDAAAFLALTAAARLAARRRRARGSTSWSTDTGSRELS
jgi:glycosyltransferase involved in cell wall biosynthesis